MTRKPLDEEGDIGGFVVDDLGSFLFRLVDQALSCVGGDVEQMVGIAVGIFDEDEIAAEVWVEAGSSIGELCLTVESELVALAVIDSMQAVPPASWNVDPSVNDVRIHAKLSIGQLRNVTKGGWDEQEERDAHIVNEDEMLDCLISGQVLRAMCGHVFMPIESGVKTRERPICARCLCVYELATAVVEQLGGIAP